MPKRKVSTSANGHSAADPVAAAIQASKAATPPGLTFTAEARQALVRIFEHNDVSPRSERVSRITAAALLNEHYGWVGGPETLERAVRRVLGRKSWGSK